MHQLVLCTKIAAEAHAKQRRKILGGPYVNHSIRVAYSAQEFGLSEQAVCAALLHDVVEDTEWSLHMLEVAGVHPVTLDLVGRLTKWWPDDADISLKTTQKPIYYQRILEKAEAVDLKLLDRSDNLNDMALMCDLSGVKDRDIRWASRYLRKTAGELTPLVWASTNDKVKEHYNYFYSQLVKKLEALTGQDWTS